MSTEPAVSATPDEEFEAWLWAERCASAEAWEIQREDADLAWADVVDPTPGVARFLGAQFSREQLLAEWERAATQVARWQAVQTRVLAESLDLCLPEGDAGVDTTMAIRSFAAELACSVRMSDRTVEQHMNDAQVLRDRFAVAYDALRHGALPRAHAQVIADEGIRLSDDRVRAEYEQIVLDLAGHLTTARLRMVAKAIAEQLLPTTIAERHADARKGRRVILRDVEDGMSEFWALVPSALAHGIHDRLTQFARTIRDAERETAKADAHADPDNGGQSVDFAYHADAEPAPPSERTVDQIRADVLCDLLLTGHSSMAAADRDGGEGVDAISGIVQITVPLQTLIDGTGPAAQLAGHGPIDPESARRIAANASIWQRVLTDPVTGDVIAVDRRFPCEAQVRHLRARDEHCRFPGCRMPVWRCDIDHTRDHQHGGPTSTCNLAHLCRRHHTMKHNTAWRVGQRDRGVLVWTSPLARVYIDRPAPTLRFIPARQ